MHEASAHEFGRWSPRLPPGTTWEALFDITLERATSEVESGTGLRRVAVDDDDRMVGQFNLSQIFRGPFNNAYAGWKVRTDLTGRGYATEGVLALLDLAFAPEPYGLGLHRVQANVVPQNEASLRVAEKAGMRREGLALRYVEIDGEYRDHVMFAKVTDEHELRWAKD